MCNSNILTDIRRGVAIHRRTQYHLSRNGAALRLVCSVLVFSSRIRVLLYSSITSSVQSLVATSKTNCTLVLHRAYKVWWLCLKQTACTLVLHRAYTVCWLCQKQPSDWSALYATMASDLPALCRFSLGAYNTRQTGHFFRLRDRVLGVKLGGRSPRLLIPWL